MKRWIHLSGCAVLLGLMVLGARAGTNGIPMGVAWSELSDQSLSRKARFVMNPADPQWVHAEGARCLCHATSEPILRSVVAEAEFLLARMNRYLGGSQDKREKARILIVSDPQIWRHKLQGADRRQDSVAAQSGTEIFVLWGTNTAENTVRLAHELAHYRVGRICGDSLPVWLDEGLAGYVGRETAAAFMLANRAELVIQRPPIPDEKLLPVSSLTAVQDYPASEEAARVLYRQAEALVRAIVLQIGDNRLADFVRAICRDGNAWDSALRNDFGFADEDFIALEDEMRKNCRRAETRHD